MTDQEFRERVIALVEAGGGWSYQMPQIGNVIKEFQGVKEPDPETEPAAAVEGADVGGGPPFGLGTTQGSVGAE